MENKIKKFKEFLEKRESFIDKIIEETMDDVGEIEYYTGRQQEANYILDEFNSIFKEKVD